MLNDQRDEVIDEFGIGDIGRGGEEIIFLKT